MSRLPDLEAWAVFAKVADTGSFARAASDLQLSQATVSKMISRLEARTKTVLFHRTSRRMSLTETGLSALERAYRILEEGEAVEAAIVEQAASLQGLIRVAAPMSFGILCLAPIVPDFMARYPDVALDVQFNDEIVDLIGNRFDLALRISNLETSSLLARRLCPVRVLLVGSPTYLEKHGRPKHPSDLTTHKTLQYSNSHNGESWRFRHPKHGVFSQVMRSQLHSNNADALTPALLAGQGLALQAEFLVCHDLQTGRLEAVMQDWQADSIALHIVTPPGRRRPARVQAFIEYLAERLTSAPWAQHSSFTLKP
ncbi:LysR family transcriptional regulator [Pectobacterium sp. CHL-2024]|uniref:LysR family transcriptional regulator n=1 Tax=Pectobacterium sp. CHL-2024 TaxID=3377079 RepID=UPI0037FDD67A